MSSRSVGRLTPSTPSDLPDLPDLYLMLFSSLQPPGLLAYELDTIALNLHPGLVCKYCTLIFVMPSRRSKVLNHLRNMLSSPSPIGRIKVVNRYANVLHSSSDRWLEGRTTKSIIANQTPSLCTPLPHHHCGAPSQPVTPVIVDVRLIVLLALGSTGVPTSDERSISTSPLNTRSLLLPFACFATMTCAW